MSRFMIDKLDKLIICKFNKYFNLSFLLSIYFLIVIFFVLGFIIFPLKLFKIFLCTNIDGVIYGNFFSKP